MREATIREARSARCTTTLLPMSARLTPSPIQRHAGTAITQALASQAQHRTGQQFLLCGAAMANSKLHTPRVAKRLSTISITMRLPVER